ncbi:SpoIIE family protein phosphatase [Streptomyces sp. NBC_01190]|uniref:ATP-binding SpoIIE family protein phosphatase n=1 Tax=Streptomyces sp. NBC_01190 TaxID=2903767 RepID=UPI0038675AC0|nr:SpoIIE family protein phosphatase [Streptomyces sp. NBC_01190]
MDLPVGGLAEQGFVLGSLAVAVVDGQGVVTGWSPQAAGLLDRPAAGVCGHPFQDLYLPAQSPPGPSGVVPAPGRVTLRRGTRERVDVELWTVPLTADGRAHAVLFADAARTREWGQGVALLRTAFAQRRVGIAIHAMDLSLVFNNSAPQMFGAPAAALGSRLDTVLSPSDAQNVEELLEQVRDTGVPLIGDVHPVRFRQVPGRRLTMSLTAYRLQDARGEPSGVVAVVQDVTEQQRVGAHLDLLHYAAERIGFSLDIQVTAQALADVVVTGLGDLSTVDLARAVLAGNEPPVVYGGGETALVRIATATSLGQWPEGVPRGGSDYPTFPDSPQLRQIQQGRTVILGREDVLRAVGTGKNAQRLIPDGGHSLIVSPLFARGLLLGSVSAWRIAEPRPFDRSEAGLLAEISSRAALGVDNARRYTRERSAVTTLQERLLPRAVMETPAARTAGVYRPAGRGSEASGDWFDVITLPSLRVAFVVGDVIGHGLRAAANMGRLRTAVQTFADLELEPGEVLSHMEDLVQRLAAEVPGRTDTVGATCLYAVYDPTSGRCSFASAGNPPPIIVDPDGAARLIDVSPGPPLGVGGMPFPSTTVDVEPGSMIALFTDGVLGLRSLGGGAEDSLERLREKLRVLAVTDAGERPLADIGDALVDEAGGHPQRDDIVLLLARTREVPARNVASWEFPGELSSVGRARASAARQLAEWRLDDLGFTTELVVSELMTNAVRHAGGPVRLRLIRDGVLVCEVSDPSNTQPRLLRASSLDEGGRGLFIVGQCTARWGCRYGQRGKTIWTEQSLTGEPAPSLPESGGG